jgi:glycerophosphoryl diester phosphodiesterase
MTDMRQYPIGIRIFIIVTAIIFHAQQNPILAQAGTGDYFPEPKNGNTYVIAHRGVHNGIPENSLPAYREATTLGCDFVEIDVRRTKDGRIVNVHNPTIDAYVNGITGKVSDFTRAALKELDIGERDILWCIPASNMGAVMQLKKNVIHVSPCPIPDLLRTLPKLQGRFNRM